MKPAPQLQSNTQQTIKTRKASVSDHPACFADIYQDEVNIAVWQRNLFASLEAEVKQLLDTCKNYQASLVVTPNNVIPKLIQADGRVQKLASLCHDISEHVEMFCLLFGIKQAGLRLAILDQAMCPRFHVDMVPCRLVTTYCGVATEWLPHNKADRSKLGKGNMGLVDEESGLYQSERDIQKLQPGDVALLKGESWQGNNNAGLIHRSPQLPAGEKRLLLTLDFYNG